MHQQAYNVLVNRTSVSIRYMQRTPDEVKTFLFWLTVQSAARYSVQVCARHALARADKRTEEVVAEIIRSFYHATTRLSLRRKLRVANTR